MIEALILYGSKARQDHDRFSDTDLLGITHNSKIMKTFDDRGISLHLYPFEWLIQKSRDGSLFLLHLSNEAVPLFDPGFLLDNIKQRFVFKNSYIDEIEAGFRICSAITQINADRFDDFIRRKYFWGLRTSLIAVAAQERLSIFSAKRLEEFSGIHGLALHIQTRDSAPLPECQRFARISIDFIARRVHLRETFDHHQNLQDLYKLSGVGRLAAQHLMYASDDSKSPDR